jgi:hypothetical protein
MPDRRAVARRQPTREDRSRYLQRRGRRRRSRYHKFKLAELAAGGFAVETGDRGRMRRVRFRHATAVLDYNLSAEITRLLPEGMPSPYRLGSGAAHARPWMLERSATETGHGGYVGEGTTAVTAAATVMFCMKAWIAAWGGYFGLDVTAQLAAIDAVRRSYISEGMTV